MRILILMLLLFQFNSSFAQEKSFIEEIMAEKEHICSINLVLKYDSITERFGFVDLNGVFIIEPQYKSATEFIDCMALVLKRESIGLLKIRKKNFWVFINKRNEVVMPPRMENRSKWENNIKSSP